MKPWTDTLPDFLPPLAFRANAWSTNSCSAEFAERLGDTEKTLKTLVGGDVTPLPLSTVARVTRDLLGWFAHPFTQHHLTYPFTEEGLVQAIGREILDDGPAGMLLACLYPEATMLAVCNHPTIAGDWSRVGLRPAPSSLDLSKSSAPSAPATSPIAAAPPANKVSITAPSVLAEQISEAPKNSARSSLPTTPIDDALMSGAPIKNDDVSLETLLPQGLAKSEQRKDRVLSEFVLLRAHNLALMLHAVSQVDAPLAVQQEHFNGLIKQDILSKKGAGQEAANYWLEDTLLPALSGMKVDQMQEFMRLWTGRALTFNHPAAAVRNSHFWQNLVNMGQAERQCYVKEVLPMVVQTESWSFKDRLEMAKAMLEKVKGKSWLVQERLGLWEAWGGDVDEDGPDPSASSSAFGRSTTTVRAWLVAEGFEKDAFPKPRTPKN